MSMFYCNSCDQLVDSDEVLFTYEYITDYWTCANCLEADPDVEDVEKVLDNWNTYWIEAPLVKQILFLNKAKNSKKRNLDNIKQENST